MRMDELTDSWQVQPNPRQTPAAGRLRRPWWPAAVTWLVLPLIAVAVRPHRLVAEAPVFSPADQTALRARLATSVIRYGGDAEGGAPFQMRDPADPSRVIGFEVELMDALAAWLGEELGLPLRAEMMQYDWVSLLPGLAKGDFDVGVSGSELPAQVPAGFRYSRPYYVYTLELMVRADETAITDLVDCRDRPVGTLSGSAGDRALAAAGALQVVGFDNQTEPYLDLELGRLDAVLLDNTIVAYYATGNPRLKCAADGIAPGAYAIALREEDELLARALDQGLGRLFADGRWTQILGRWRLWNADQSGLAREPERSAELAGLGFDEAGAPLATTVANLPQATVPPLTLQASRWRPADYLPLLGQSALTTVGLTVASMALAMVLGLVVCTLRLYGPFPVNWGALGYVEFFRGVPLLLVLLFLYFGLSSSGLQLPAVATAILGFGLNYAAYEAEVYRSAILAVPPGQWEAALALGMSRWTAFWRVIFPQALRTALAPMTNDLVALFKDTSLVSVIAVRELTKEYQILARSSLQYLELGLVTAALYLLMSVPLGYLSRWLERRWGAR